MSFPLNLAMFSLLLFRAPVKYDFDVWTTTGIPQFSSNEYINDSLLFESFELIENHINGNVIETQLGQAAISTNINRDASLYFYRLNTMIYDENGYLKESYSPLYVSKTKVDMSNFQPTSYQELFKIEFNLHAPQELFINLVIDENFGDVTNTTWFLTNNKDRKSHYHDYYYVFNVDYAYYDSGESIISENNNNWYKFDLKGIFTSNVNAKEETCNINLATLNTHDNGNTGYGQITQLNNYICFKDDNNFSQVSYDSGFTDGYNVGRNESVDQSLWIYSFTRSVFNGFAQVLNVDILPNIKLGYLIAIPLVLSVLRFILGFFKGD